MATSSRFDVWEAADNYEAYMGRWSRPIGRRFLDWLAMPDNAEWLELGCGTGVLTAEIVRECSPANIIAMDPSEAFVAKARAAAADPRVEFRIGGAGGLASIPSASRDAAVAGLVLNFVPERAKALQEMKRVVRSGGMVGFYVWDYPGGGLQIARTFWTAAVALDPSAADLVELGRFSFCTREGLAELASTAGLSNASLAAIESPAVFKDFEDYWRPFRLGGAGPAPVYCASLPPKARESLRQRLSESLPRQSDGSIVLNTRAWAVKARVE